MLLALIMLLSACPAWAETPAAAYAAVTEYPDGISSSGGSLRPNVSFSNSEAANTYIMNALYPRKALSVPRSAASADLMNRLSADEKVLYNALLAKFKDVAAGKIASTAFSIPTFAPKFTKSSVRNSWDQVEENIDRMVINVFYALLADCSSELYWFDKTQDNAISWKYSFKSDGSCMSISNFRISYLVAKEYSANNTIGTTRLDTSKATAIQNAAAKAKSIIQQNRGKSDTEKLRAYKNEICRPTDYNHQAVQNDSGMPYGNPWQLVWVFDGNPETKVVCEGYSKAFQYLCELSSFSGSVSVMSMNGFLYSGDAYLGRHMWNVVTMSDKKRYLVDVTNCDTGASGAAGSDALFMAGYDSVQTSANSTKYIYGRLGYVFDQNISNLYTSADQDLNGSDYNPASDQIKASGRCGSNAEWSLRKGVLKIEGSGAMADYTGGTPAPWQKHSGSIKKIVIGDSITRIGNYAFNGLKAVKTAAIGKKVKTIGKFAFNGCKRLASVAIKGTKLNTVGNKAFKGISAKAVFTCPAKKLSAYKKLLLKKGAPKTAVFK